MVGESGLTHEDLPDHYGLCSKGTTESKQHGIVGGNSCHFITNKWYFVIFFLELMTYDFVSFYPCMFVHEPMEHYPQIVHFLGNVSFGTLSSSLYGVCEITQMNCNGRGPGFYLPRFLFTSSQDKILILLYIYFINTS